MRFLLTVPFFLLAAAGPVPAEDGRAVDRALFEALREAHDRGADLYNNGDTAGCYRVFQGGLIVARGALSHRPDLKKQIVAGLASADQLTTVGKRAFALHELIEKVRGDLKAAPKKAGELIPVPPREVKADPKPAAAVGEVTRGVVGRVMWQGKPVAGVEVAFVSLGRPSPVVYEAVSGTQGGYAVADISPGKYIVTIVPGPAADVKQLPARYATTTTSPLIIDVKAGGEKLDFVLQ